jgi:uncharacterized protein (DUF1778 family)
MWFNVVNKSSFITVRIPREKYDLVKRVCFLRGEDISDFVRRAIYRELALLSVLSEEEKKSLGVTHMGDRTIPP